MTSLHTPGPWRVGGPNLNVVYGTEPDYRPSLLVAHANHTGEVPPDVDVANARLIAAAPDLLRALKAALLDRTRDDHTSRIMASAIEKAEGR